MKKVFLILVVALVILASLIPVAVASAEAQAPEEVELIIVEQNPEFVLDEQGNEYPVKRDRNVQQFLHWGTVTIPYLENGAVTFEGAFGVGYGYTTNQYQLDKIYLYGFLLPKFISQYGRLVTYLSDDEIVEVITQEIDTTDHPYLRHVEGGAGQDAYLIVYDDG